MTPKPTSRQRVAIINDDPTQLRLFTGLVQKEGLQAIGFQNAEEALRHFRSHLAPDLVVSDLYMPGIDGWQFCRLLRSPDYSTFNTIPILVTSATFSGEDAAQITAELGANAFLPCPVDPREYLQTVRTLLAGQQPQRSMGVLVIEGDAELASSLLRAFESHGYRTWAAATGAEAQTLFADCRPEIVTIDFRLPDTTGDTLLAEFRKQAPFSVFVMTTGDPDPNLALDWMKQGANAYVRKPFEVGYLIALCQRARRERSLLGVEAVLEERTRQLRQSEERFRTVASFTYDWEYWLGPDGLFRYVSPSCERITGYPPSAFLADPTLFLSLVHPEDRDKLAAHLREVTAGGSAPHQLDFRIQTRQGEVRWIGHACTPVQTETGDFAGVRASNRDITDQKRAEAERLDMEQRMLQAQKLESLGVMAGGIAHDFNNLLTAILGNLDLALWELPPMTPTRDSIEQAVQASRRAADLARQMLAYSGHGHFLLREVDLNELVKENASSFRAALPKAVTLTVQLSDSLPKITADPAQVQQLVTNLIVNSAEAIEDRIGVIRVATCERVCDAAYLSQSRLAEKPPPGRFVCLEVTDSGCGMTAATLDRLFDPFYTTKFTGRGLGLSVVLGIVRGHRGAVLVKSELGQGTVVQVLVPAGPEEVKLSASQQAASSMPPSEQASSPRGTVLVVDDEAPVRNLCVKLVERLGLRAVSARDGEEALERFREHPEAFDIVLLDLSMPRLDGLATFQAMKRLRPEVPIVLCSGYAEPETVCHLPGIAPACFLQKPYQQRELKEKIQAALRASDRSVSAEARPAISA